MSKNKPKAAPQPPIAFPLGTRLDTELTTLARVTHEAVKGTVEAPELKNLDTGINALTLLRVLVKDTEEEKKASLDAAVPDAVKKHVKDIEAEAKRIKKAAEQLEELVAAAINAEVAAGRLTDNHVTGHGCQLILQKRKELQIEEGVALPPEYTLTVPDRAKIEAALKDWEVKREAAKVLGLPEPACPVPGARIGTKVVLVTKAPELIEE